ncbi:kelch repeat-containing protein [Sorangium sp. So ce291]|uniref:kelch repeat-containing protein n=1 Tax=Sorangium sp. So ce291 TaxID=3133294 RepID=UPI003F62A5E0
MSLLLVLFVALASSVCLGCGEEAAEPHPEPASALRDRFPAQAAQVLAHSEGFVPTAGEFALSRPSGRGAWQSVGITLPRDGSGAIRFRGFGGTEVRVRELGVLGEGTLAERAVAFPRDKGTSYWSAAPGGVEEWLLLEENAARAGEPVATWDVENATVRQRGDGVEVVDADGVVRLSVTAPKAYALGGREVAARLAASGTAIELLVDAAGETVLVDPMWQFVAPMRQSHDGHTATLLPNGNVLVTCGLLAVTELYDPATNTWSLTGPVIEDRAGCATARLPDGRVLVSGGENSSYVRLASAELYDPATNTWSAAAPMSQARRSHVATLLGDGRVLVSGGGNTAELYDPATNTWSPAGTMSQARFAHTATLLASGKVLVTGNASGAAGAELYDPVMNTWSPAPPMSEARSFHTATLLANGKVLVAGGAYPSSETTELYDPATNTWSAAAPMLRGRSVHAATLLPDGKVLVLGGHSSGPGVVTLASTELYDPATNTWSADASMSQPRSGHSATLLPNGDVLAVGGNAFGDVLAPGGSGYRFPANAELYRPLINNPWSTTGSMAEPRAGHVATRLDDGRVLVTGGYVSPYSSMASAELYDPATRAWLTAAAMSHARRNHTATLLGDGKVLVTGGRSGDASLDSTELYEPETNTWSTAGSMSTARANHTATLLGDGKVLVTGGRQSVAAAPLADAELYDPVTNTWSITTAMSQGRKDHSATLLDDGRVLVVGGSSSSLPNAELYTPETNTWSATSHQYFWEHTATLLASGKVLVKEWRGDAKLYDPGTNSWSLGPSRNWRSLHTATLLGNGEVLIAGGQYGPEQTLWTAELYDPATDAFSLTGAMGRGRAEHTATRLSSGEVLVVGGREADSDPSIADTILTSAELYALFAPLGSPCAQPSECQSGVCADGVCCNVACDAGPCDACSVAAGAATDGTCAALTGPACDDGSACTQADTCRAGVCVGENPVVCASPDPCHVGVCDPATGACASVAQADGAPCDDADACTRTDTCQAGICTGVSSVVCAAPDACHLAGRCDPRTGACTHPAKPDGASCDDGTCTDGVCAPQGAGGGGAGGTNGSGHGGPAGDGGCGCRVGSGVAPMPAAPWVGLALLLLLRRRRSALVATRRSYGATPSRGSAPRHVGPRQARRIVA